jgi:two-component system, NarL family, nitrate/nitrite response regulator NarL
MNKRRQKVLLLIADDQPVFLQGLAEVFKSHPDIKIVAQCRDGAAAMQAIRELSPSIALIDIFMPRLDGLDVLAAVNSEQLQTQIIFLTSAVTDKQMSEAISRGAKGIVFKSSSPAEITRSVRKVAAGKYQFPKDLAEAVRRRQGKRQRQVQLLTPRETEVTRLVIKGLSNKEIGRQMDLSEGTVKIHLHNIYKKLSVSNRTALAAMMIVR